MTQQELISQLKTSVVELISTARVHSSLGERLRYRPSEGKWNAIECYEHMNLYGDLYLGYFNDAIEKGKPVVGDPIHRSGWLGGYSARSMEPKEVGVRSPMKTFKSMNPIGHELDELTIVRFIKQQEQILHLLDQVEKINIDKVRCATTLKFLRFKLSDTLKFFVTHNRRHILQASRALESEQS